MIYLCRSHIDLFSGNGHLVHTGRNDGRRNSSGNSLPLRGRSTSRTTPWRWQTQPTRSAIGRIRQGYHRSHNRTWIHPVRPSNVHKRMCSLIGTNGQLQPTKHLAGSPSRAILTGKPRHAKPNGHVDSGGTHTAAVDADEFPKRAHRLDTPRNLLFIELIAGNNTSIFIFHASHGTNTS